MIPTISLEDHFISKAVQGKPAEKALSLHLFPEDVRRNLLDIGEGRIADMDDGGISLQVISHIPADESSTTCQEINDQLYESVKRHPTRFAGFATLPVSDPVAAAKELERCVKELGFVGAMIPNHTGGTYFDGEAYLPMWEKAQELDVPIYLHPSPPASQLLEHYQGNYSPAVGRLLAMQAWGWHADVAVHVLRLYVSGLFDRFDKLKVVVGHMGEMLPFMKERIDARLNGNWGACKRDWLTVWKENLWFTTSGMWYLSPMSCLLKSVAIDRIMYSVDYPLESNLDGKKFIQDLEASGLVDDEALAMIAYKNAENLLGVKARSVG